MKLYAGLLALFLVISGCKEESSPTGQNNQPQPTVTDAQLYQLTLSTSKAAFYKNSTDTISGSSGAAHPGTILVWYNAKAKTQLDAAGKVKSSPNFPDSSLIVKEIFDADKKTRTAIAIMFKLRNATNANANGWVWSEVDGNGNIIPSASAAEKGAICIGCHSTGTGLTFDYTRMNDHP